MSAAAESPELGPGQAPEPTDEAALWPNGSVAVDCVVFGARVATRSEAAALEVLLVRRGLAPFEGTWALPGGFVRAGEGLESAARRELEEETGLDVSVLEQLYTFGEPGRDPRGRVVSVAWLALVRPSAKGLAQADGSDAVEAAWFPVDALPELAFDHGRILDAGMTRLRAKVTYDPLGFDLLDERFALSELRALYEVVLGRPIDKRNFRRKVLALGVLEPTGEARRVGQGRPAQLYRVDRERYDEMRAGGFDRLLG